MSIESQFQALLVADVALTALVPAARIITGRAPRTIAEASPFAPYLTIERPAGATRKRTRDAVYRDEMIRVTVWAENYAQGEPIERAMIAALDNRDFELEDGTALDIRQDDGYALQDDEPEENYWQIVRQFSVIAGRARQH